MPPLWLKWSHPTQVSTPPCSEIEGQEGVPKERYTWS
jgi:hypothetical protein